jgi:hypothetical protein
MAEVNSSETFAGHLVREVAAGWIESCYHPFLPPMTPLSRPSITTREWFTFRRYNDYSTELLQSILIVQIISGPIVNSIDTVHFPGQFAPLRSLVNNATPLQRGRKAILIQPAVKNAMLSLDSH